MQVDLPAIGGSLEEALPTLFDLADDHPTGWVLAGAQMVVLHALHHGIVRPVRTEDADVIVDIRHAPTSEIAEWLTNRKFEADPPSPGGVRHRFRRGGVTIDVLSVDHTPGKSSRTTIPPTHTIEVPGGRRAIQRSTSVEITTGDGPSGALPVPDWLGAVLLKARAVIAVPDQRPKHTQDLALLLSLPVDLERWINDLAGKDRSHIRSAGQYLDEPVWDRVSFTVDIRAGLYALEALGAP